MESGNKSDTSFREDLLLRVGLNDNKAGMQGLDKEKINKIIMEASKGSKFYENELKKDQQVNKRIEKMLELKNKITDQQIRKAQLQVDKIAMGLEQRRDLSCTIVHIDMDAFYAAVEMRDNPDLRDKPIAVGSLSMLSTSNYHARRYGVRAAMPGFIAKKLCPHLVIVPLNFQKYKEVSKKVREILVEYDPYFMPVGLDEAYVNITEYLEERKSWDEGKRSHLITTNNLNLNGNQLSEISKYEQEHEQSTATSKSVVFGISAEDVVKEMRFRIEQKTGLTASAGIAPNTMLAKMCSDQNKPNGQYRIPAEREAVMSFIKDLAIRKVPGIGKVTEKMLKALGIGTCTDLYQQRALISLLFSETSWRNFLEISLGLGSTHLERDEERKSMSTERTFNEISATEQYTLCKELCSDLAQDLKKEGLKARTVTLKLKNVNFEVRTRATTVMSAVSTEEEIFAVAKDLLRLETESVAPQSLRLRLMGIRVSGFLNEEERKYQQKSIVNFLEPGKQASTSRLFSKKSADENLPKASESFFNKKRAAGQQASHGLSSNESSKKLNLQETTSVTSVEQERDNEFQIFMCPVCFEEHQGSTLQSFNQQIDKCLAGTLEKDNGEITDISITWENTTDKSVERENEEYKQNNTSSAGIEMQSTCVIDHATNRSTNIFHKQQDDTTRNENGCSISSDFAFGMNIEKDFSELLPVRGKEYIKEQTCTDIKSPCSDAFESKTLTCPVCNLEQKTNDLTLFNTHVDVCLNKGIIKQLTESSNSVGTFNRGQDKANSTGGSKRYATMVPHSTSKKAKSQNSKCTIETFFK